MNLKQLCAKVCLLAQQVGIFVRTEANKVEAKDIEEKFLNNLVSYVDITAEKQLVQGLKAIFPAAGFIVEENTIAKQISDYQWIVDPLDGTTNFLHHIPCYAISIALAYKNQPILGVVYEINRSELFYAWRGGGAYLNNQPIRVSQTAHLTKSLIATGFPYYDFTIFDQYLAVLKKLIRQTKGIRRLGAAAVDLCYVACGRFDAFFEHSLSPWDVAAGSLIVQESGGYVTDFSGNNNYIFGKQIIATNQLLQNNFLRIVKDELT